MWILILILVSRALVLIYTEIQNNKLLRTVTHKRRGTRSERDLVLRLLKNGFSSDRIFHDLYVQKSDGNYSQIDVVIVADIGIIVVEVKELSGWIFGTGLQSKWFQVLAYGKKKYSFYNPILQNNNHVKCLESRLSHLEKIPFYSVIIFYGDCVLKNISQIPRGVHVVKSKDAIDVISYLIQNESELIFPDLAAIEDLFFESVKNGENSEIRLQHIENIRDKWNPQNL